MQILTSPGAMMWLYRLQQRIAMTRSEAMTVCTLATIFLLGLGLRYVQQPEPLPADHYAEAERLFEQGTASLQAWSDSLAERPVLASDSASGTSPDHHPPEQAATVPATVGDRRVNLNTATRSQLEGLPRIGPKMAQRILDYRERYGPFLSVRDLLSVRGIGEKTLARLEPYLYLD